MIIAQNIDPAPKNKENIINVIENFKQDKKSELVAGNNL